MGRKKIANIIQSHLPKPLISLSPKQVQNLKEISAVVLGMVGALGVGSLAIVAPNALKLLKYLPHEKYDKGYFESNQRGKKKIARAIYYLRQNNYVKLTPQGNDFIIKLTHKGKKKLKLISFQSLAIPQDKKWDKGWWFILADIPVEFKAQIELLRKKLKSLGALTFQRSVWVYPYDPRVELEFLSKYYGLEKYITAFKASDLNPEDEKKLRRHFKTII